MKIDSNALNTITNLKEFDLSSANRISSSLGITLNTNFKLYQAFYISEFLPPINISVIFGRNISIVLLGTFHVNVGRNYLIKRMNEFATYYPKLLDGIPIPQPTQGTTQNPWFIHTILDDKAVRGFNEGISTIDIKSLKVNKISFRVDSLRLEQHGRYFQFPEPAHMFSFDGRNYTYVEDGVNDYYFYFMYLLKFMKTQTDDQIAQNVIEMLLRHYY